MQSFGEKIAVIAAGPLSPRALDALALRFDVTHLAKGDATLVTSDLAAKVRGVAVMGGCTDAFISALPKLEIIASFGVGYDAVDVTQAVRQGVIVTHTPDVLNDEVADTAVGLLIATLRDLPRADAFLRQGRWAAGERFPLTCGTLSGRKVGIFGLGRIGRAIALRLQTFNVEISYHNRRQIVDVPWTWHPTLLDLARSVDTLICVAPGGRETTHATNAEVLAALGRDGVLINIGRGSTVDEAALVQALRIGTIMAAGLDVYEHEPKVPPDLLALPNTVLLPHVGSASIPTRNLMSDLMVKNLTSWFDEGRAITPVPEVQKHALQPLNGIDH
ncbi:2-hydroxyacid dehydrogenase [Mesorhizobium sp. WSM4887]|uniref:2-hydroxyacid dehydrogenase n=1 Tax=Mesorhizobium sp. WSM4887 TaxID=3038543 RepID=UPI0024165D43|nr:2-hydroxyacid dehydrogenase [Mesorhizobium sp. WSM4887]MDG4886824.1 2-hydroxyacid dehydrogenase [Mesorhizobium sp. WSM4887]